MVNVSIHDPDKHTFDGKYTYSLYYIYMYICHISSWLEKYPLLIYLWNPCWIFIYIYSTQKKDPFHLFKRAILKVSVSGEESKFP